MELKSENRKTMKAIRQHEYGNPDVLKYEEAPLPEVKQGEVLIQVKAIGLNPPDWYLREGYKDLPPEWQPEVAFPIILGTDIAGIIIEIGDDVKDYAVGDEVYSMVRFPSYGDSKAYAEYVSVSANEIALKPKNIDFVEAAAAPMSLLTAWQFLIDLGHNVQNPLQDNRHEPVPLEGKKVLINGAGGGVGHFMVQLANWKGAYVVAVASGKQKAKLLELGADEFIDYTQQDADKTVSGLDLVIDCVGGPTTGRFLKTLKKGGSLFPVFPLGFDGRDEAEKLGVNVSATQVRSNGSQLEELAKLIDDNIIKVVIDSVFPFKDAKDAHRRAEQGHIQGKIALKI